MNPDDDELRLVSGVSNTVLCWLLGVATVAEYAATIYFLIHNKP